MSEFHKTCVGLAVTAMLVQLPLIYDNCEWAGGQYEHLSTAVFWWSIALVIETLAAVAIWLIVNWIRTAHDRQNNKYVEVVHHKTSPKRMTS